MAVGTYRKRRRTGILTEDQRSQAIKRLQNESSARSYMENERRITQRAAANRPAPVKRDSPAAQQRDAEQLRERANRQRRVTSHGGAPKGLRPGKNGLAGVSVKSGQTLWGIAQRRLGSGAKWRQIARANNISDPRKLQVGTHLTIPGQGKAKMRKPGQGRGDYGGGLPDRVARMRSQRKPMVYMNERSGGPRRVNRLARSYAKRRTQADYVSRTKRLARRRPRALGRVAR